MLQDLNRFLRYGVVVGLILLVVLSVYYKYDNCSTCKFKYEGEKLSAGEFMQVYRGECLAPDIMNISINVSNINFSFFSG